jgi:DNA-binding CsgD family transcriptional regulator
MDRARLEQYLKDGLSLPQIGTLENRDASTVGYWVKKYGLTANGKEKFAPRGGLTRDELQARVEDGLTVRQIAAELHRSESTVNHWLRRHGLKTRRAHDQRREAARLAQAAGQRKFEWECPLHGPTYFHAFGDGRSRCAKCSCEAVSRRRRGAKELLAAEAGGSCAICGYDRYLGALQFHHKDRRTKSFAIGGDGVTRAIERLRAEAEKCVLLCANCHAEVEGGVTKVP